MMWEQFKEKYQPIQPWLFYALALWRVGLKSQMVHICPKYSEFNRQRMEGIPEEKTVTESIFWVWDDIVKYILYQCYTCKLGN